MRKARSNYLEGIPLENRLLRARAAGEISADDAFEQLFRAYAGTVTAWLSLRADRAYVDDLAQDVWLIFYTRFQRWEVDQQAAESPDARPVLSFLFRTCRYVALGHARLAAVRAGHHREDPDELTSDGATGIFRELEAGRCLSAARRVCTDEMLDVLFAKLAGMSAREIGAALDVTEAVVDHRYRDALSCIRSEMKLETGRTRRKVKK